MSNEIRPVPGYLGYGVDARGNVYSQWRPGQRGRGAGTQNSWVLGQEWATLKLRPDRFGYPRVSLYVEGKRKLATVHSLVLLAFVGPRPSGMHVCHNDSCPTNNRLENLRYDTPKGNSADMVTSGRVKRGERHYLSKLNAESVRQIRCLAEQGVSHGAIAQRFGVTDGNVWQIVHRKSWVHVA